MSSTPPSFPAVISSSMRSEFVACPRAFFHRYMQGYRKSGPSIHLHFGAAFAAGLDATRQSFYSAYCNVHTAIDPSGFVANPFRGDLETALSKGAQAIIAAWGDESPDGAGNKTLARCVEALEAYFGNWPPALDHLTPLVESGHARSEFSFAHPLPILHPTSGEPILYSGKFDMLAKMGESLYIEDDKTTSQLGASWSANWKMRAQFSGYCWGARQFGYPVQGAIVRGISILKKDFGFAEVIEQRPDWMIDRWHSQLLRDVERMIQCWRDGFWDQSMDSACSSYGGCQFLDLCTSHQPEKWLSEYVIDPYDPMGDQS